MIEIRSKDIRIFLLGKGIKFEIKKDKKYAILSLDKFIELLKEWKKIKSAI